MDIIDESKDSLFPSPSSPKASPLPSPKPVFLRNLSWVLWLAVPILIWALWPYRTTIQKNAQQTYLLKFEFVTLAKLLLGFYGLYVLPGLLVFYWVTRKERKNFFFTPFRLLLAFSWGMSAHVLASFIQKYLHFSYSPFVVLGCLALAYVLTGFCFRPLRPLLIEDSPERKWEFLTWPILILTFALGVEMVLRARTSSLSLMGDTYGHFILLLGTLKDGPFPNGLPFYSTFVLNLYPLGFHGLLAGLMTLLPGIEPMDLFRYFSLLMVPCFIFSFFAFFSFLSKSRPLGALATLALLSVSGGGYSLRVPIVYFPWYWSLAWCLTAAIFYLILKDQGSSKAVSFWAGILLGVSVLLHPMMAPRMGAILLCFFPLEMLRRILTRTPVSPLFSRGGLFILGTAIPLGIWLVPMVLRFGWEETYSYEYILRHFESIAPEGVGYIRYLMELHFGFKDLYPWIRDNGGVVPLLLAPLGLIGALKNFKNPFSPLLLAWIMAMAFGIFSGYLPNPYRYFEYLFLGLVALAAFGMGWVNQEVTERYRPVLFLIFLSLTLVGVRHDFWPKYREALKLYGRTDWPENPYGRSRRIMRNYNADKEAGQLDRDFGGFRGFLWPRQKKVWDIYIRWTREKTKK